MDSIILLAAVALLVASLRSHALAQASVITKVDRQWFERLFAGSRASKDNLSEAGRRYRKRSNLYALGGLVMLGVYLLERSAN